MADSYRRFEEFLEGKIAVDIPRIVPRVCGICPISHALASCKANENALGIRITQAAQGLRRLMLLCEIIKSHTVHTCFMMMPDLDCIELQTQKELALNALELVKVCDDITRTLAGRSIHPLNCLVGGMSKHLDHHDRQILEQKVRKGLQRAIWMQKELSIMEDKEENELSDSDKVYMGLQKAGEANFYDGDLRLVNNDESLNVVFSVEDYKEFLVTNSNDKLVFRDNKQLLVGPVARSRIGSHSSGNKAQIESKDFTAVATRLRLNEVISCLTEAQELLSIAKLSSSDIRVPVEAPTGRGVGVVEAPRGTLIHDYEFKKGYVEKAHLLVPTSFNLSSMETHANTVLRKLHGKLVRKLAESCAKKAIRAFDPCISCLDA
ncbi:MAG: nickel-dependent hydrogenase large subunit [Candidatus Bathyarchaeota archaeon]|nr:MAG: nickel-dependent hydrogenase large subunit [Candidatus Bathyarchaeota archaeon]